MKLLWTRELDAQNPWEPEFHGIFSYQESGISFYYKDEHLVRCVHGQMDEPEILFEGRQGVSPPLPHDWMIIKQDDALFLLCGEQIAIELKTGRSKIPAPDNLQSEYQRRKPSPEHFVEDSAGVQRLEDLLAAVHFAHFFFLEFRCLFRHIRPSLSLVSRP